MTIKIEASDFPKGLPWKERHEKIAEKFPSVVNLDWEQVFEDDPAILGRIINDMLRLESSQSRPGKRPALDPDVAAARFKKLFGEDYSSDLFPEALRKLKGDRSLRHVQANTNVDKMKISAFLKGEEKPTLEELVSIAKGLGKDPAYFMEYRNMYVISVLNEIMTNNPEMGITQFRKVNGYGSS